MIKYILLIIIGQCFAGFKVGIDFSSRYKSEFIDTDLDSGIVFSYDHMFNDNWGIGSDYLFPTEVDYFDIEIGVLDFYMLRKFYKDKTIGLTGKVGYSLPDFEWQNVSDVNGGIMYGFDISFFNEVQISYSIHNSIVRIGSTITGSSTNKNNIKCNRLTLFYLF